MDPMNPDSFNHRTAKLSTGRTYHFVDQLPSGVDEQSFNSRGTRTVLCVHGFPDLWYAWRFLIPYLVHLGYRVIVPDMLGYGGTDKPHCSYTSPSTYSPYSQKSLCADLAALLDFVGVERAIVMGHDWGALVAWRFGMYYSGRVEGLVAFSVPYIPPAPRYISPDEAAQRVPNFTYQAYFAREESTEFVEKNLPAFLSLLYTSKSGLGFVRDPVKTIQAVAENPEIALKFMLMTKQEYDYYLKQFSEGGMQGPLSYYRTTRPRFDEEKDSSLPPTLPTTFPVLFIYGGDDPTCSPRHVEASKKFVKGMEVARVEGVGHWVLWQGKEVVDEVVGRWLERLEGGKTERAKL